MSKDTRYGAPLGSRMPSSLLASLSLAAAAAMLTPVVQANTENESQSQQTSAQQSSSQQMSSDALSQLAEQEGDISKFLEAVEKAGMAEALSSGTQYTIFAPTNDALESNSDLQRLMESSDPQDQQELVNLLRAHIVADDVDPEMAKTIGKAKTVGGGEVELTSDGEKLQVGGNQVVTADIQQGDLRVYTIDGVLEPSSSASMASTSGTQSSQSGSMAEADFDQLDQDGDGYLSEGELQAQEQLAAEQDQLDSDQDGRLSRTEFAAFEQEQSSSSMPSSTDPQSTTDESGSQSDWPSDDQR